MSSLFDLLVIKPVRALEGVWSPISDEVASFWTDFLTYTVTVSQLNVNNFLLDENNFFNFINVYWLFFQQNVGIPVLEFIIADINVKETVFTQEELEYYWKRSSTIRAGVRSRLLILLDCYAFDFTQGQTSYSSLSVETKKYLNFAILELSSFLLLVSIYSCLLVLSLTLLFSMRGSFKFIDKFCDRLYLISLKSLESEKEFSSLEDYLVVIAYYIVVYLWSLLAIVYLHYLDMFEYASLLGYMPILLVMVIVMPVNLIIDCGALFVAYLRGVGSTTILLLECLYDVLATLIMFVRLLVQHIRFFLMFFAFYELMEFCYWNSLGLINYNESLYTIFTENVFYFQFYTDLIYFAMSGVIQVIKYMYEMAHYLFIVTSQFFAYFGLVFWLFSFLYTSFFDVKLESLFKFKRN